MSTSLIEKHDAVTKEVLKDNFLLCRTIGHAWFEAVRADLAKPEYGWRLVLKCDRCACERHDIVDPENGDVVPNGRRYFHPDGYEMDEKATRSEMRREWAKRNKYVKATRKRK